MPPGGQARGNFAGRLPGVLAGGSYVNRTRCKSADNWPRVVAIQIVRFAAEIERYVVVGGGAEIVSMRVRVFDTENFGRLARTGPVIPFRGAGGLLPMTE